LRDGIRHLERAVALDPAFALAWVSLHQLYGLVTDVTSGGITDSAQKATLALARAQELAPDSPFVLYQAVLRKVADRDWLAADETYQAAVEAAAKYSVQDFFNYQSGLILQMFGRASEAIDCYERGKAVDPLHVNNASYLCDAYSSTGRWKLGLAEADRFESLSGQDVVNLKANALQAAMVSGDRAELDKRLGQLIDTEGGHPIGIRMRSLLEDPETARAELRQMLKDPANEPVLFRNIISTWAAYFDDPELALELLRVNMIEKNTWAVFLPWRGIYRDVRRLPGFKDLLRDLGFVDYWRESGKWADFVRPLGDDDFECIG
jgi:tetratricopeptide (TPR) repeat protein